jgi:hypothetical protein
MLYIVVVQLYEWVAHSNATFNPVRLNYCRCPLTLIIYRFHRLPRRCAPIEGSSFDAHLEFFWFLKIALQGLLVLHISVKNWNGQGLGSLPRGLMPIKTDQKRTGDTTNFAEIDHQRLLEPMPQRGQISMGGSRSQSFQSERN